MNLYEVTGKVCAGVLREVVFVNRGNEIPLNRSGDPPPPVVVLSPGDFLADVQEEPPRPADASPRELPISNAMWRTKPKPTDWDSAAGLALTVRVKPGPGCVAESLIWSRLASLPASRSTPRFREPALVKTVTNEALRLFVAT